MSNRDGYSYIGYSQDLKKRIEEHNKGYVLATKHRRPLKLVYYEACLNREDAMQRERYLKTTQGGRMLKMRLKNYLQKVERFNKTKILLLG